MPDAPTSSFQLATTAELTSSAANPQLPALKPSAQTGEFWLVVGMIVALLALSALDAKNFPPVFGELIAAVLAAGFAAARKWLKAQHASLLTDIAVAMIDKRAPYVAVVEAPRAEPEATAK